MGWIYRAIRDLASFPRASSAAAGAGSKEQDPAYMQSQAPTITTELQP